MATRKHYAFEMASQAELDAAVGFFVESFVLADKRERVVSLFSPLRKRARPRDLIDSIDRSGVVEVERTSRPAGPIARIDPQLEGVLINGEPAAFRMTFGQARELREFAHSDEEVFIARDGGFALIIFEIGPHWFVTLPTKK